MARWMRSRLLSPKLSPRGDCLFGEPRGEISQAIRRRAASNSKRQSAGTCRCLLVEQVCRPGTAASNCSFTPTRDCNTVSTGCRQGFCKPRALCIVTWIIRQPISPPRHVYKLRLRTSQSGTLHYTSQYTLISTAFLLTGLEPYLLFGVWRLAYVDHTTRINRQF
jgi:hypothetical protein